MQRRQQKIRFIPQKLTNDVHICIMDMAVATTDDTEVMSSVLFFKVYLVLFFRNMLTWLEGVRACY